MYSTGITNQILKMMARINLKVIQRAVGKNQVPSDLSPPRSSSALDERLSMLDRRSVRARIISSISWIEVDKMSFQCLNSESWSTRCLFRSDAQSSSSESGWRLSLSDATKNHAVRLRNSRIKKHTEAQKRLYYSAAEGSTNSNIPSDFQNRD